MDLRGKADFAEGEETSDGGVLEKVEIVVVEGGERGVDERLFHSGERERRHKIGLSVWLGVTLGFGRVWERCWMGFWRRRDRAVAEFGRSGREGGGAERCGVVHGLGGDRYWDVVVAVVAADFGWKWSGV